MTRPKDLTLESPPVDGDSVPVDSAGGGTRRSLVSELRDATKLRGVAVSATAPRQGQSPAYDVASSAYLLEAAKSNEHTIAGFEDFEEFSRWSIWVQAGGKVESLTNGAPYGILAGSGLLGLSVTAAVNSTAQIAAYPVGLALDPTTPTTYEARFLPSSSGAYDDTQFEWLIGFMNASATIGGATTEAIGLYATWTAGVRAYKLMFMAGGVETHSVAVTLPVLGGGKSFRIRISATSTGATLEAAIDFGAYSVIGTLSGVHVPAGAVYQPMALAQRGSGSGSRTLAIDYIAWSAARTAAVAGAGSPLFVPVYKQKEVLDRLATSGGSINAFTDDVVRVDTTSGNLTFSLPDPALKRMFVIVKVNPGVNTISLSRYGGEKIMNVAATYLLPGSAGTTYPSWTMYSDGIDWWRVQ